MKLIEEAGVPSVCFGLPACPRVTARERPASLGLRPSPGDWKGGEVQKPEEVLCSVGGGAVLGLAG